MGHTSEHHWLSAPYTCFCVFSEGLGALGCHLLCSDCKCFFKFLLSLTCLLFCTLHHESLGLLLCLHLHTLLGPLVPLPQTCLSLLLLLFLLLFLLHRRNLILTHRTVLHHLLPDLNKVVPAVLLILLHLFQHLCLHLHTLKRQTSCFIHSFLCLQSLLRILHRLLLNLRFLQVSLVVHKKSLLALLSATSLLNPSLLSFVQFTGILAPRACRPLTPTGHIVLGASAHAITVR
mmetsp:Transcript_30211/g.36696  ORF Transcript_30211/g.36696 Transcript_30211/m.36696 type:complete len:233 (+) Transcript_30211:1346-2044(+)